MSDYSKATNFAAKDTLASGNPSKIVKGTEIDNEFNAIAGAIASKVEQGDVDDSIAAALASLPSVSGRILQIVSQNWQLATATGSASFGDTFAYGMITPSSASSKILILSQGLVTSLGYSNAATTRLIRGYSGANVELSRQSFWAGSPAGAPYDELFPHSYTYVDSPASTSAVRYGIQVAAFTGGNIIYGNDPDAYQPTYTNLTLIEIL